MVTIIFESHGTTLDNEAGLSSVGEKQAKELGERRQEKLAAIFCSDLQRSYRTAEIAFSGRGVPMMRDMRLRECDYGDLTHLQEDKVKAVKADYTTKPFPNGESYEQTTQAMKDFLNDLLDKYDEKTVLIISHRATQYGLEHWLRGVPLAQAVTAPWLIIKTVFSSYL